MTLLDFIRLHKLDDSPFGDLARDIEDDRRFPFGRGEERMVAYLKGKMRSISRQNLLRELIEEYEKHNLRIAEYKENDSNYVPIISERWEYLKSTFECDKVIANANDGIIYKLYTVDSKSGKSLLFELFTNSHLGDTPLFQASSIYISELSSEMTLPEAIDSFKRTIYPDYNQPTEPNYSEMLEFLKSRVR